MAAKIVVSISPFEDIGLLLKGRRTATVAGVRSGTSTARAGLQAGDELVAINDIHLEGLSAARAVEIMAQQKTICADGNNFLLLHVLRKQVASQFEPPKSGDDYNGRSTEYDAGATQYLHSLSRKSSPTREDSAGMLVMLDGMDAKPRSRRNSAVTSPGAAGAPNLRPASRQGLLAATSNETAGLISRPAPSLVGTQPASRSRTPSRPSSVSALDRRAHDQEHAAAPSSLSYYTGVHAEPATATASSSSAAEQSMSDGVARLDGNHSSGGDHQQHHAASFSEFRTAMRRYSGTSAGAHLPGVGSKEDRAASNARRSSDSDVHGQHRQQLRQPQQHPHNRDIPIEIRVPVPRIASLSPPHEHHHTHDNNSNNIAEQRTEQTSVSRGRHGGTDTVTAAAIEASRHGQFYVFPVVPGTVDNYRSYAAAVDALAPTPVQQQAHQPQQHQHAIGGANGSVGPSARSPAPGFAADSTAGTSGAAGASIPLLRSDGARAADRASASESLLGEASRLRLTIKMQQALEQVKYYDLRLNRMRSDAIEAEAASARATIGSGRDAVAPVSSVSAAARLDRSLRDGGYEQQDANDVTIDADGGGSGTGGGGGGGDAGEAAMARMQEQRDEALVGLNRLRAQLGLEAYVPSSVTAIAARGSGAAAAAPSIDQAVSVVSPQLQQAVPPLPLSTSSAGAASAHVTADTVVNGASYSSFVTGELQHRADEVSTALLMQQHPQTEVDSDAASRPRNDGEAGPSEDRELEPAGSEELSASLHDHPAPAASVASVSPPAYAFDQQGHAEDGDAGGMHFDDAADARSSSYGAREVASEQQHPDQMHLQSAGDTGRSEQASTMLERAPPSASAAAYPVVHRDDTRRHEVAQRADGFIDAPSSWSERRDACSSNSAANGDLPSLDRRLMSGIPPLPHHQRQQQHHHESNLKFEAELRYTEERLRLEQERLDRREAALGAIAARLQQQGQVRSSTGGVGAAMADDTHQIGSATQRSGVASVNINSISPRSSAISAAVAGLPSSPSPATTGRSGFSTFNFGAFAASAAAHRSADATAAGQQRPLVIELDATNASAKVSQPIVSMMVMSMSQKHATDQPAQQEGFGSPRRAALQLGQAPAPTRQVAATMQQAGAQPTRQVLAQQHPFQTPSGSATSDTGSGSIRRHAGSGKSEEAFASAVRAAASSTFTSAAAAARTAPATAAHGSVSESGSGSVAAASPFTSAHDGGSMRWARDHHMNATRAQQQLHRTSPAGMTLMSAADRDRGEVPQRAVLWDSALGMLMTAEARPPVSRASSPSPSVSPFRQNLQLRSAPASPSTMSPKQNRSPLARPRSPENRVTPKTDLRYRRGTGFSSEDASYMTHGTDARFAPISMAHLAGSGGASPAGSSSTNASPILRAGATSKSPAGARSLPTASGRGPSAYPVAQPPPPAPVVSPLVHSLAQQHQQHALHPLQHHAHGITAGSASGHALQPYTYSKLLAPAALASQQSARAAQRIAGQVHSGGSGGTGTGSGVGSAGGIGHYAHASSSPVKVVSAVSPPRASAATPSSTSSASPAVMMMMPISGSHGGGKASQMPTMPTSHEKPTRPRRHLPQMHATMMTNTGGGIGGGVDEGIYRGE